MLIEPSLLAVFVVTTFVAMITPRPDMLFVLGCGFRGGPRVGLFATAGVATSEVVYVAVAAGWLAALFAAAPTAFIVVRLLAAAYLVSLGIQILRSRHQKTDVVDAGGGGVTARKA